MRYLGGLSSKIIVGVVCVALVGLGLGITSVRAAAPDNYRWVEYNNGLSGIFVAGFAIDPTATSTMYVLLVNRGVYKSTDGGITWNTANGTYPTNFPYYNGIQGYGSGNLLTINPYNPQILYASAGGKFYETTDGGNSWNDINGNITICAPNYQGIKIVVDPTSSSTLFATHSAQGCGGGLYVSTTTSSTPSWVRIAGPGINTLPNDSWPLAIDPTNHQNMYVATFHNEIFYSHDGGVTWTQSSPLSDTSSDAIKLVSGGNSIMVSPTATSTIFMGFSSPNDTGMYVSHDAGATWVSLSSQVPGTIYDIQFASSSPLIGYAVGDRGIYKTTDGGATWVHTSSSTLNGGSVIIDPKDTNIAYIGTLGEGLYKTSDGGVTFTALNGNLPLGAGKVTVMTSGSSLVAAAYGLGVFRSVDRGMSWQKTFAANGWQSLTVASGQHTVYLGSQSPFGIYRSVDDGNTWTTMTTTQAYLKLAVNPKDANELFGEGMSQGNLLGKSFDGGVTWATSTPFSNMIIEGIHFDPFNSLIVYAHGYSSGSFYRSTDGGNTWATSTAGCTDCATAMDYLGVSPYTPGLLFASTRNNYIYKSIDYGATWTQVGLLPPSPPNNGWAYSFVFDPSSSSTIYAGDMQYSDAWYKTTDGGTTWNKLPATGYPEGIVIGNNLIMDPSDSTRFISGNSQGVYIYENAIPVTASSTFLGSTQATVLYNQSLGYTVTVNNTGYATSSQTQVRITLPANVTISSATWNGVPITPSLSGTQAAFSVGDIAPLGTGSLVYHVVIGSSSACNVGLSQSVQVISTEDTQGTVVGQPFTVTIPCPSSSLPPEAYMTPVSWGNESLRITINDGAATTHSPIVTLSISGGSNVSAIALSNVPDFSGASQQPYVATTSWDLCAGIDKCLPGAHTVYARWYTRWGQASRVASDAIVYEPIVPDGTQKTSPEKNLSCSPYLTSAIAYGSATNRASDVKKLQVFLNKYCGENIPVTGVYDQTTFAAVKRFQQKYARDVLTPWGLSSPTGWVYTSTIKKINEIYCLQKDAEPEGLISCPYFVESLKRGSNSPEVRRVQEFLRGQGFLAPHATLSSVFDSATEEAVKKFQKRYATTILVPLRLSESTGRWYAATKKQANKLVGCEGKNDL